MTNGFVGSVNIPHASGCPHSCQVLTIPGSFECYLIR